MLATKKVRPVLRMNFDSQSIEVLSYFFHETKASISCMPMGSTHLSWHVTKRNVILAKSKVCPILKTNFDPQQNERLKYFFFAKPKHQYHVSQW